MKQCPKITIFCIMIVIGSFSNLYAQAPCTPDEQMDPTKNCWPPGYVPSPGFPHSPTEYKPLNEVVIHGTPSGTFLYPTQPAPFGGVVGGPPPQTTPVPPCPGAFMTNPSIASSGGSGYNGGTYGYTRNQGTKFHDGMDIAAPPGTPIFAQNNGVVSDFRVSFAPNQYAQASYGNFIEISYIVNGKTITMSFNHLNSVASGLQMRGASVTAGQYLGTSGRTGNAGDPPGKISGVIPHVHIKARENGQRTDPAPLLKTKFDKNTGGISVSPCN